MSTEVLDLPHAHRYFAVECNNRAWDLYEQGMRTVEEVDDMLRAAHAAAFHWYVVGTPVNRLRAIHLLAATHLAANRLDDASYYTKQSLALVDTIPDTTDWDCAVTHALVVLTDTSTDSAALHFHRTRVAYFLKRFDEAADRTHFLKLFPTVDSQLRM